MNRPRFQLRIRNGEEVMNLIGKFSKEVLKCRARFTVRRRFVPVDNSRFTIDRLTRITPVFTLDVDKAQIYDPVLRVLRRSFLSSTYFSVRYNSKARKFYCNR